MNFFALNADPEGETEVFRLRMSERLRQTLDDLFSGFESSLIGDQLERLEFDPGYKLDRDEVFCIDEFELQNELIRASNEPQVFDNLHDFETSRIKSIFGAETDGSGQPHLVFQSFDKRQLLNRNFTLLFNGDTYQRLDEPGLVISQSASAVVKDGSLYFRNLSTVNRFLDMTAVFVEATDDNVYEVLTNNKIAVDDIDSIINELDSVMRKRFMAVIRTGVLDTVVPAQARREARKYGIELEVRNNRIVFPCDRKSGKAVLKLLMEQYYEGEFTGQKYVTSSQRRLQ